MSAFDPSGSPARDDSALAAEADPPASRRPAATLPLSKLRGVPAGLRQALKARRITGCDQLLAAAAAPPPRRQLAERLGVDEAALLVVVRRADMARVIGVGAVFGMMLEELGVLDVAMLAASDPAALHERLRRFNVEERIARRSPTPEEVLDWVAQAKALPKLVR